MTSEPLILANLKMNVSGSLLQAYRDQLSQEKIGLFVSYPYLSVAEELFADTNIWVGAQSISPHEKGAYTGQVSGEILADIGVRHVLVGHSEVRAQGVDVSMCLKRAHENGLNVVYCIGEDLQAYQSGSREGVLVEQLKAVEKWDNITIAYEPVWSIGTGKVASCEDVRLALQVIRHYIKTESAGNSEGINIVYGGSVNNNNCLELLRGTDVNGFLIGGAALSIDKILEVVRLCK